MPSSTFRELVPSGHLACDPRRGGRRRARVLGRHGADAGARRARGGRRPAAQRGARRCPSRTCTCRPCTPGASRARPAARRSCSRTSTCASAPAALRQAREAFGGPVLAAVPGLRVAADLRRKREVVRAGLGQQPRARRGRCTRRRAPRPAPWPAARSRARRRARGSSPSDGVAQRLLAVAHDLLDGRRDGAHALDLDERDAARRRRGTRGRPARRRSAARARPRRARPRSGAARARGARAARAPAPRARAAPRRRAPWRSSWCTCSTTIVERLVARPAGRCGSRSSSSRTLVGPGM